MKEKIPQIKKKVNSFLVGEEGKISKGSLMKAGFMLGAFAAGTIMSARNVAAGHSSHDNHDNDVDLGNTPGGGASVAHSNSHSNVNTHSSHSAHSSGGWC